MFDNMMDTIGFVTNTDPQVGEAMNLELQRQRRNIELIASENIVSPAVMAAMGSVLTNKYAEGYPGKRYYGWLGLRLCTYAFPHIDRAYRAVGIDSPRRTFLRTGACLLYTSTR